nr:MBL fold metallo-hydrolase [Lachnospiraceae bacterium]
KRQKHNIPTTPYPVIIFPGFYYFFLLLFVWKTYIKDIFFKEERIKKPGKIITGYGVVGILCFCLFVLHLPKPFEIDMLSVGQGDGIFIRSKENVIFMIDGGSTSMKEVGKYVLEPFLLYQGVNRIDYWMLSHMDTDHISGCMELLEEGFPVSYVILPKSVIDENEKEPKEHYEKILQLCKNNDTEVLYIQKGERFGTTSIEFLCLGPNYPSKFLGTNENSMILKLSYGKFNVIFTGDMGSEQEKVVLEEWKNIGKIEVLKAAHHGSKNSNCIEWLQTLSPSLSIISAGKDNLYGHPSWETLNRMDELDISYLCTIEQGQIKIRGREDGRFWVIEK